MPTVTEGQGDEWFISFPGSKDPLGKGLGHAGLWLKALEVWNRTCGDWYSSSQSAGSSALLTLPSPTSRVLVLLLKAGVGEGALTYSANVSLAAWILLEPGRAQTEVVYTGF